MSSRTTGCCEAMLSLVERIYMKSESLWVYQQPHRIKHFAQWWGNRDFYSVNLFLLHYIKELKAGFDCHFLWQRTVNYGMQADQNTPSLHSLVTLLPLTKSILLMGTSAPAAVARGDSVPQESFIQMICLILLYNIAYFINIKVCCNTNLALTLNVLIWELIHFCLIF